jgi:hypothetical protein
MLTGILVPWISNGGAHNPLMNSTLEEKKKYYKEMNVTISNYELIQFSKDCWIRVVFTEFDQGIFLIRAKSRSDAYRIGNLIRGYLAIFWSLTPPNDRLYFYLQEIPIIPKKEMTWDEIIEKIPGSEMYDSELLIGEFRSGPVLTENQIDSLKQDIPKLFADQRLSDTFDHLTTSLGLYDGSMTGSYYYFHYSRDRKATPKWVMQKKYLENRQKYELAFLAAFKGVERFLKGSQIKAHETKALFSSLPYSKVKKQKTYTRFHETFSGFKKKVAPNEIVNHFLAIRNVTGAHANRNPPQEIYISEDNIIEIQRFLKNLLGLSLASL